eukprot:gene13261-9104_t
MRRRRAYEISRSATNEKTKQRSTTERTVVSETILFFLLILLVSFKHVYSGSSARIVHGFTLRDEKTNRAYHKTRKPSVVCVCGETDRARRAGDKLNYLRRIRKNRCDNLKKKMSGEELKGTIPAPRDIGISISCSTARHDVPDDNVTGLSRQHPKPTNKTIQPTPGHAFPTNRCTPLEDCSLSLSPLRPPRKKTSYQCALCEQAAGKEVGPTHSERERHTKGKNLE